MKTRKFTRLLVLLLVAILGLSGLAVSGTGVITAQAAAGDTDTTYSIALAGAVWGHPTNLTFRNGMVHHANNFWNFLFVNAFDHRICYCIEPGTVIPDWGIENSSYTEKSEDWFDAKVDDDAFNSTIDGRTVRSHLGRIMQYGYVGQVPWAWRDDPTGAYRAPVAQAIATQIMVWEVIVGERDAAFNHVAVPAGFNSVLEVISSSNPLRADIMAAYAAIENGIKAHTNKPSFMAETLSVAQTVTLKWDGSKYSATLTDSNNVLGNYSFSASGGVSCSVSGNKLILSSATAPSGAVTVTATKQATRRGVVVWYKESYQAMASYGQEVDDPIRGYVKVEAEQKGKAQIVKNTTNGGTIAGWPFTLYSDSSCTTVVGTYTSGADGTITTGLLAPGTYYVKETGAPSGVDTSYWVMDTTVKTVTVKAGETASVTFTNRWEGKAKIIKVLANPEAGSLEGWPFTVKNSSGGEVGTYTTNASGEIVLDLEPGTYTVTEILPENSIWECTDALTQTVTVKAGQTAVVTYTNALRPGEIHIQKENTKGEPLAGVEFLLEWSEDGVDWFPMTYSDCAVPEIGGCTTEGLVDGRLVSDENGLVTYTGLYPTLQYRLTETVTQDGYQLLTEPVYEGELPVDNDLTISLKVVNAEIFTLPQTGAKSMALLPLGVFLCLGACAGAIVFLRQKEA